VHEARCRNGDTKLDIDDNHGDIHTMVVNGLVNSSSQYPRSSPLLWEFTAGAKLLPDSADITITGYLVDLE